MFHTPWCACACARTCRAGVPVFECVLSVFAWILNECSLLQYFEVRFKTQSITNKAGEDGGNVHGVPPPSECTRSSAPTAVRGKHVRVGVHTRARHQQQRLPPPPPPSSSTTTFLLFSPHFPERQVAERTASKCVEWLGGVGVSVTELPPKGIQYHG